MGFITALGWILKALGFFEEAEGLLRAHAAKKAAQAVADAPKTVDELEQRLHDGKV